APAESVGPHARRRASAADSRRRADGLGDAGRPDAGAPVGHPGLARQAVRSVGARHAGGAPGWPGAVGLNGDHALSRDGASRGADVNDGPPAARVGVTPRPREFDPTLIARLDAFARATGVFVISVGSLVLLGWVLGLGALA